MPRERPGSKRMSFHRRSTSSIPRVDATETAQEKHRMQVKGKADPSKAIVEAEPITVANSEVTLGRPLRAMQHRDQDGNIIVDPDRSNPTRPRLERPLDTIRSFEAAIDGSNHRKSSYRGETPNASTTPQTRRTSYMSNYQASQRRGHSDIGGHFNDRSNGHRSDSYYDGGGVGGGSSYANGASRRPPPRNNSDPALYGQTPPHPPQKNYPSHVHQQSYETVGGVSNGTHMTEPWGNSTDPSSENSSIDRMHPTSKTDAGETYGFHGFGANPQLSSPIPEEYGHDDTATYRHPQDYDYAYADNGQNHQSHSLPPVPQHDGNIGRPAPPPKDAGGNGYGAPARGVKPQLPEKRKSWLKRFSKS